MSEILRKEKVIFETREATFGRFFNELPIPEDTFGVIKNYELIAASSAAAKAELATFTQDQLEEFDKVMKTGKLPEDPTSSDKVIQIGNLLGDISRQADAASVIIRTGGEIATHMVEHYRNGFNIIGDNSYWIQCMKDKVYLCTNDDQEGLAVYFNREEQFREPGARAAGLQDYLQLLRDFMPPTPAEANVSLSA